MYHVTYLFIYVLYVEVRGQLTEIVLSFHYIGLKTNSYQAQQRVPLSTEPSWQPRLRMYKLVIQKGKIILPSVACKVRSNHFIIKHCVRSCLDLQVVWRWRDTAKLCKPGNAGQGMQSKDLYEFQRRRSPHLLPALVSRWCSRVNVTRWSTVAYPKWFKIKVIWAATTTMTTTINNVFLASCEFSTGNTSNHPEVMLV